MGLFDGIKGEAQRNFIARPDEAREFLVYRYPETNIRMMTQVTVQADEVCMFVKDGVVQGVLQPGRHTLDTNNVPFVSKLLEGFTGGNLFMAEVYFVLTRERTGVKFGGPIGELKDPESGLAVGTMVYGEFSVRITNPQKLIVGLIGLHSQGDDQFMGWFKSQVLKIVRDRVAELMVKKGWPLLNVTSGAFTEEIEQVVLQAVTAHVDDYGVHVVKMGNFVVSIAEEDATTLKKFTKDVAYSKLAGGFANYAQSQAVLSAGEGMAKGGEGGGTALQGMGLGMGFAMAQNMGQRGPAQAAPAATAMVTCGACGATVAAGKFCASCGKPLAAAGAQHCTNCGTALPPGAKFCAACGNKVG
jgi:membrane protease subunit (stomatin/prohibitin family)